VFTNSGGNVKFIRAELEGTEKKNMTAVISPISGRLPVRYFPLIPSRPSQLEWPVSSLRLPLIHK
jgi:hypothetical protein